ncbi:MAG: GxxExxY protein [Bacteroidales bacterium]
MPIEKNELDFYNKISFDIIGCAYKVHHNLGPGLLESAYKACMVYEIGKLGYSIKVETPLPLVYEDVKLEVGYRIDILVENKVLIELKSVEALSDIHTAQILTYLKLSGTKLGLLINFNVPDLKDGIKRFVL